MRTHHLGVVIEDALAKLGSEHVALRVAKLGDDRKRERLDAVDRLLRCVRPGLKPIVDRLGQDRHNHRVDVIKKLADLAGTDTGRRIDDHALGVLGNMARPIATQPRQAQHRVRHFRALLESR